MNFNSAVVELEEGEVIDRFEVTMNGRTSRPYATGIAEAGAMLAGNNEIVCTVYATSGETATYTRTITAYPYYPPTASFNLYRCDDIGLADTEGGNVKVEVTGAWASVGLQNILTTAVSYRLKTDEEFTEAGSVENSGAIIIGGELRSDRSYEFRFTVSDTVGNRAEYTRTVPSEFWAMKFSSDGHGVAFGEKTAQSGVLKLASGMCFKMGNTALTEADLYDLLHPQPVTAGVEIRLLWTNESPSTSVGATTIDLDLTDYDAVFVQVERTTGGATLMTSFIPKDGKTHPLMMRTTSSTTLTARDFEVTDAGVEISNGYSGTTAGKTYMIPTKIWGIKGIT